MPSLAHLTCISSTKQTVEHMIHSFKDAGIENIMALRGDIPKERLNDDRTLWDYRYAVDLIRDIKRIDPGFCIGGAAYPEIHPESKISGRT